MLPAGLFQPRPHPGAAVEHTGVAKGARPPSPAQPYVWGGGGRGVGGAGGAGGAGHDGLGWWAWGVVVTARVRAVWGCCGRGARASSHAACGRLLRLGAVWVCSARASAAQVWTVGWVGVLKLPMCFPFGHAELLLCCCVPVRVFSCPLVFAYAPLPPQAGSCTSRSPPRSRPYGRRGPRRRPPRPPRPPLRPTAVQGGRRQGGGARARATTKRRGRRARASADALPTATTAGAGCRGGHGRWFWAGECWSLAGGCQ